jgi:anti-sigma factor RsiW
MAIKQVPCPERVRRVPAHFSWVDHRLVRERYLEQCDAHAAMLYLFLVTVADAQGLSWYSDESVARRLSMDAQRLRRSRSDLMRIGLIAWVRPVYQVLALDLPPAIAAPVVLPALPPVVAPQINADDIRAKIAGLRAVLGKRP